MCLDVVPCVRVGAAPLLVKMLKDVKVLLQGVVGADSTVNKCVFKVLSVNTTLISEQLSPVLLQDADIHLGK